MSSAVENKFTAYRHTANGTHPSFAFPLAAIIAHLPVAVMECFAFCGIAYPMTGMTLETGRFFFFLLIVFLSDVFAACLFRSFAFIAPHLVAAQAGPMPIIALLILFAGFMVTPGKMGWVSGSRAARVAWWECRCGWGGSPSGKF
jgi:ATP-binding cassette subfamily G (WHITE) protein 2 (SNQ2)